MSLRAAAVGAGLAACRTAEPPVLVAVAASTESAVEEALGDAPYVRNAHSTSTLARQLLDGAPGDVFLAADAEWADVVAASRPVLGRVDLLSNRLVEVVAPLPARGCTALADPDHVPAGRYARQGLQTEGRWPPADAVPFPTGPAAAFAVSNGDCAHGVVYATDAARAGLEPRHTLEVRATYPLLLLHERGRPAFEALQSPSARAVFARHGFGAP